MREHVTALLPTHPARMDGDNHTNNVTNAALSSFDEGRFFTIGYHREESESYEQ